MSKLYRVTSPNEAGCEPDDSPADYEEDGLIRWVDEVFQEGYKHILGTNHCADCARNVEAPFLVLAECLGLLEGAGYTVEVIG